MGAGRAPDLLRLPQQLMRCLRNACSALTGLGELQARAMHVFFRNYGKPDWTASAIKLGDVLRRPAEGD